MTLASVDAAFKRARAEGRAALMPYWSLGYPNAETSLRVIDAVARAGADMMELGVPFSDPLADGPVVQHANQTALDNGITVRGCLDITTRARSAGATLPMFAMGYLNPVLQFGEQQYVEAWRAAGASGLIIPDLPPEQSTDMVDACRANDMAMVQFAAPTSTDRRLALAAKHASGFVYVVSVAGTTGARNALPSGLREYVTRVKKSVGGKPVVVGFGISTAEHVREVGEYADGVIVASALLRHAGAAADPAAAAYDFVRALRA
jgi:tryptophan synthase alpha chain